MSKELIRCDRANTHGIQPNQLQGSGVRQLYSQAYLARDITIKKIIVHKTLLLSFFQAAQAYYVWVRASEVIWSKYTRIISVLSDAK